MKVVGIESLSCAKFGDLYPGPVALESKLRIVLQGVFGYGLFFLPRLQVYKTERNRGPGRQLLRRGRGKKISPLVLLEYFQNFLSPAVIMLLDLF